MEGDEGTGVGEGGTERVRKAGEIKEEEGEKEVREHAREEEKRREVCGRILASRVSGETT